MSFYAISEPILCEKGIEGNLLSSFILNYIEGLVAQQYLNIFLKQKYKDVINKSSATYLALMVLFLKSLPQRILCLPLLVIMMNL